jgi:hypothetical protein
VAPATAGVERLSVLPLQTGLLLEAVGVAGVGFTVTDTVPVELAHPATVTVNE